MSREGSKQSELESALPVFGHLVLGARSDITLSISTRKPSKSPSPIACPKVVTASPRDELHIILEGSVGIWGTAIPEGHDGTSGVEAATWREFAALSEIHVKASSLAFSMFPLEECKILTVSGKCESDWELNIEAQSGRVVSRSFANPVDSSLASVLKLAMHLDSASAVCAHAMGSLNHANPRVRLIAMKTLVASGSITGPQLAKLMRSDSDKAIQRVCMKLKDVA